jgi:hypothetical protein
MGSSKLSYVIKKQEFSGQSPDYLRKVFKWKYAVVLAFCSYILYWIHRANPGLSGSGEIELNFIDGNIVVRVIFEFIISWGLCYMEWGNHKGKPAVKLGYFISLFSDLIRSAKCFWLQAIRRHHAGFYWWAFSCVSSCCIQSQDRSKVGALS